jgi:CBS domain-containing protein
VIDLIRPLCLDEGFNSLACYDSRWLEDSSIRRDAFFHYLKDHSIFGKPSKEFLRKETCTSKMLVENDSLYNTSSCLAKQRRHWTLVQHKMPTGYPLHFSWLSQTDIVRYINTWMDKNIGRIKEMQILQLAPFKRAVHAIREEGQPAILAFKGLFRDDEEFLGLPILDNKNELIDSLSGSDLRGITAENAHDLLLPATEYLKLSHIHQKRQSHVFLVTLPADATLKQAVNTIVANSVHRAFVTNDLKNVTAVVTLTDILRAMLQEAHIG